MNSSIDLKALKEEIIELQTKLQFQEDALQTLDDVVIRQADVLERLQLKLDELEARQEQWLHEASEAQAPTEEKPPHY